MMSKAETRTNYGKSQESLKHRRPRVNNLWLGFECGVRKAQYGTSPAKRTGDEPDQSNLTPDLASASSALRVLHCKP